MSERRDLPLPDYDQLPTHSLEHRIRSLRVEELQEVVEYEEQHANRLPVLEILRSRLDQLSRGASPSSGSHAERPEQAEPPAGRSPAGPETAAEPEQPLRHGMAEQTPKRGRG